MAKELTAMQKRNKNGEEQFVDRQFHIDWKKDLTEKYFSLNVRIFVCRSTLKIPTVIFWGVYATPHFP